MASHFVGGLVGYYYRGVDSVFQGSVPCASVIKVRKVCGSILSNAPRIATSRLNKRAISPLSMLWWMSLVVGARAQMTEPFQATIELSSLDGTNGFIINGENAGDNSGRSVSSAGDINGDGVWDLVIGAHHASPNGKISAGKVYVLFGSKHLGSTGTIELSSLDGNNGFFLNGEESGDECGNSVSSAGDVNGDGFDDLVIGARSADLPGRGAAGKSYVLFGDRNLGSSGIIELGSLIGRNGFIINGVAENDYTGYSVSSTGDFNADGITDLVIGAWRASPLGRSEAGRAYIVFGSRKLGINGTIELLSLNDSNGLKLIGEYAGDQCGWSVSGTGDVNNDGVEDTIIGAIEASPYGRDRAGKSYVVFGNRTLDVAGTIELSSLDGNNGYSLIGKGKIEQSGRSVSIVKDINGDGISDILIGAHLAHPLGRVKAGQTYVVFGSEDVGKIRTLELTSLNGTNGFIVYGEGKDDHSGTFVSGAGDINGDGINDVIIGANGASPPMRAGAGKAFVVFGSSKFGIKRILDLSNLDGKNGFELNGESAGAGTGLSVSSAGDVNGDGIDDIVIGALYASPSGRTKAGKSYVVFGRNLNQIIQSSLPSFRSTSFLPTIAMSRQVSFPTSGSSVRISSFTYSFTTNVMKTSPQPSANSSLLQQFPASDSTPLIAGLATTVGVLACSLFAWVLFYFKRCPDQSDSEQGTPLSNPQSDSTVSADYVALNSFQPGMQSARVNNIYDQITPNSPISHYKAPPQEQPSSTDKDYDKIDLTRENKAMLLYQATKRHKNYDDILDV